VSIGAVIREARKQAGLTQRVLARRIRVDQSVISRLETGERPLDVIRMIDLARALRLTPEEFLRRCQEKLRGGGS
jgi:HTH-type transcriptional regulator / antitoxin HipB